MTRKSVGPQAPRDVGDGRLRPDATLGPLQPAYAPGVGIPVVLGAEEVARGAGDGGADPDGPSGLDELVGGSQAEAGEVLLLLGAAGRGDGLAQDGGDASQGQRVIKEVGEELGDPAEGAVAEEGEAEDDLAEPGP